MIFNHFTLSQRIFFSMIGLMSCTLLIMAAINIKQIQKETTSYNIERLARKDRAVAKSIEASVNYNLDLNSAFSSLLSEVGHIHKLKINIYNLEGKFILSSDTSLLVENVITSPISKTIIDSCFSSKEKKLKYEREGYFGTYRILYKKNNNNRLISSAPIITNSPFCILDVIYDKSTKDEIVIKTNKQVKSLIKIYIILLLFTGIFAYFLLNQITRPLRSISKHLSLAKLEKKIKPLHWPVKDEIGLLVLEYNKLMNELEIRTQQLIQSEKEGAWKKMAKQIAHEIKNPLTPMRLNVQYLLKSFNDGDEKGLYSDEWAEKLNDFSKTMIQQIDTLTKIANAFSDFESLNMQMAESFDVSEEIKRIIHLFKNNNVKFQSELSENLKVFIDKSHLTRILNNLINNSLQAENPSRPIEVLIILKKQNNHCSISVQDNGGGISKSIQNKIFQPNFTTKNSGMGLGLAIVKNIIDDFRGDITYSTSLKGTVFKFTIPLTK